MDSTSIGDSYDSFLAISCDPMIAGERLDDLHSNSIDGLSAEEAIALTQLLEMGFSINQSRAVITNSQGNLHAAIASILDKDSTLENKLSDKFTAEVSAKVGEGQKVTRQGILQKLFKKMSFLDEKDNSRHLILNNSKSEDVASDSLLPPPMNPAYRSEIESSTIPPAPVTKTGTPLPQSLKQEHYNDNSDDYINSIAVALSLSTQKSESSASMEINSVTDSSLPTTAAKNSSPPSSQSTEQFNDNSEDFINSLAIALSLSTQEVELTEGTFASPPLQSSSSSINISPSSYNYKNSWDVLHSTLSDPCLTLTAASIESIDAVDVEKNSESINLTDVESRGAAISTSTKMDILSSKVESMDFVEKDNKSSDFLHTINVDAPLSQSSVSQEATVPEYEKMDENIPPSGFDKVQSDAVGDESNSNIKLSSTSIASYVDDSRVIGLGMVTEEVSAGKPADVWFDDKEDPTKAVQLDSQASASSSSDSSDSKLSEITFGGLDFRYDHENNQAGQLFGKMPASVDDRLTSVQDFSARDRLIQSRFEPDTLFPSNSTNEEDISHDHEEYFPPRSSVGLSVEPSAPMMFEEENFDETDELDLFSNESSDPVPAMDSHVTALAPSSMSSLPDRSSVSRELQHWLEKVNRRQHLPYTIRQVSVGKWVGEVSLKQTALPSSATNPQGNRPDSIVATGNCATREICEQWCMSVAPPKWFNKSSFATCLLCPTQFGIFAHRHHCRNCGYVICNACSQNYWPSSMLPSFYFNKEKNVRICDDCNTLMLVFVDALKAGDQATALAVFNTGNVNLHRPFSLFASGAYGVHFAAMGGNLSLLKWLVESEHCPIFTKSGAEKAPLTTTSGMTVFAIAAKHGYLDMMRYLARERGCSVTEIKDVDYLQRGLHVALELSGPLPPFQPTKKRQKVKDEEILFTVSGKVLSPPVKYKPHTGQLYQVADMPGIPNNISRSTTLSSSSSQSNLAGQATARADIPSSARRSTTGAPSRESFAHTAPATVDRNTQAIGVRPQSALPPRESFALPTSGDRSTRTSGASMVSATHTAPPPTASSQQNRSQSAVPSRQSFAVPTQTDRSTRTSGASASTVSANPTAPPPTASSQQGRSQSSAVPSRESFAFPTPTDRSTRTSGASASTVSATPTAPPPTASSQQGRSQSSAVPSRESFTFPTPTDRSARTSGASMSSRSSFDEMGSFVTATAIPVAPTTPIVRPSPGGRIQVVANSIYVPPSIMNSPNYHQWSNTQIPIMEVVDQPSNQPQNGSWLGRGRR
eukprot:gene23399-31740_t